MKSLLTKLVLLRPLLTKSFLMKSFLMQSYLIKPARVIKPSGIIIIIAFLVWGCAGTAYVPLETIKTEYRNIHTTDSIHIRDSVFMVVKGDTVYTTRWRVEYRDRFKMDSIVIRDSIPVPYPVPEYIEKKLSRWQEFRIKLGSITLGAIGFIFLGWLLKRRM